MTGADEFKAEIQNHLNKRISPLWFDLESFEITLQSSEKIYTNISKQGEMIKVSLGNTKYPDDPIIRFYVSSSTAEALQYFDIQYLNGLTLVFYSPRARFDYDIRPDDLDMFLKSWSQMLLSV